MGSSAGLRGFKAEGSGGSQDWSGWVKNGKGDSSRGSKGVGGTARKGSAGEKEVVGRRRSGMFYSLAIFPCLSLPKKENMQFQKKRKKIQYARLSKQNSPEVFDHKICKMHNLTKKKEDRR